MNNPRRDLTTFQSNTTVPLLAVQLVFQSRDIITVTLEDGNNTITLDIDGMDALMSNYMHYLDRCAQGNSFTTKYIVFNQPNASEE